MSSDIKHILKQAHSEARNENIAKIFKKNKKILLIILAIGIASSLAFTCFVRAGGHSLFCHSQARDSIIFLVLAQMPKTAETKQILEAALELI